MKILERESYLASLNDCATRAASGRGNVVFLGATAGGGKTTLVEEFTRTVDSRSKVATVSCDSGNMSGPFGTLADLAGAIGYGLESILDESASRDRVFRAVFTSLRDSPQPTIIIGEDAHWTDEATLDLIRYLARRIGATNALIVITYRDNELDSWHPLRRLLGDLVSEPAVTRITLPPLSVSAVAVLTKGTGIDPETLHERTGGNPFYVTELIASGNSAIPDSIRDAVMGRAAPVSAAGRAILDAAAVLAVPFDPDLMTAIIGAPISDTLDQCLAVGLLRPRGERIAFQHALVRDVFADAMSVPRRRDLSRRILGILEAEPDFGADAAQLAHHAEGSRDVQAVLRYATEAAREAAQFGAHREAATQYNRALRFGQNLSVDARAELLEAGSLESYHSSNVAVAISDRARAIDLRKSQGDLIRAGDNLRWLSRMCWIAGRNQEAEAFAQAAFEMLEPLPPGPELAMALSNLSQLRVLDSNLPEAIHWGNRAIELATSLGSQSILAHALTNVGTARLVLAEPEGSQLLEQSISIGLEHGLDDDVSRAQINLAWTYLDHFELDEAERRVATGIAFASERDLVTMEHYLKVTRARMWLARGMWAEAAQEASAIVDRPSANAVATIPALTVLGRVAAVKGGNPDDFFERALDMATPTGQLMRLGPLRAARAEAAWLAGDTELAVAEASLEYATALRSGERWLAGELALWLHRGGREIPDISALAEPFALEISGRGGDAATIWRERGHPIGEVRALASTGEESALLYALSLADRLGAKPDAARITRGLRVIGVTSIPRGPRPETRSNAAHLTGRELDVLTLLVQEKTNREIAESLFLSPRTVGHHVSAILGKLEISSRNEAATRVEELRLFADRSSRTPI